MPVTILAEPAGAAARTFSLVLSSPQNATLAAGSGTATVESTAPTRPRPASAEPQRAGNERGIPPEEREGHGP